MSINRKKSLYIAAALEKFSFNGIAAMLVLYMTQNLVFNDGKAFEVFSAMMALGFISPIIGGWLADHDMGNRNALICGSGLMVVGLYSLILRNNNLFYLSLGLTVLGSGLIRSNLPDMLGKICDSTNQSKDAVFTVLYIAYNIGTFLGAIGCAIIGELFGWNISFILAGTAMLIFLILIILDQDSFAIKFTSLENKKFYLLSVTIFLIFILAAISILINYNFALDIVIPIVTIFGIGIMLAIASAYDKKTFSSVIALVIFMILQSIFFALYSQENMSLILFAERNIDHSLIKLIGISQIHLFGFNISNVPTTFFQVIDPAWNIILGGIFALLWKKLHKKNITVGAFSKFSIGIFSTSVGFALLSLAIRFSSSSVSPWWMILTYGLFVIGELCIIPVGFSLVSTFSPKKYSAIFMGIWFLSFGFSMWFAGILSKTFSALNISEITSNQSAEIYMHAFNKYALLGILILVCVLLVSPFFNSINKKELS